MNQQTPNVSQDEQKLMRDILEIGETLITVKDSDLAKLDERRFVAVFLPMFAGDAVQHYVEYGANIDTWRKIAGGPMNEVIIINDQGVELYRVPPLFDINAMEPLSGSSTSRGLPSISDMLSRANLIAKQGPIAFNTYLTNELNRRAQLFGEKKDEQVYIERWNAIFQRYNRPLISSTVTNQIVAGNEKPVSQGSDDFEPIDS